MNILPAIAAAKDEMVAIYRDLHANPELGFEETRTSKIVAESSPNMVLMKFTQDWAKLVLSL